MEVTVQNFSGSPATNVSVRLEEQGIERPAIEIEKIEPGRNVTRQFEVRSPTSGQRRISAYLQADAVALDNARHTVIDFPNGVPILIIDGGLRSSTANAADGYFLQSALAPPGTVSTGLRPRVEAPRFLDDHPLEDFHAIYLCNVDRVPLETVNKLTKYVESGGGLAFFVGDGTRADFLQPNVCRRRGPLPGPARSARAALDRSSAKDARSACQRPSGLPHPGRREQSIHQSGQRAALFHRQKRLAAD